MRTSSSSSNSGAITFSATTRSRSELDRSVDDAHPTTAHEGLDPVAGDDHAGSEVPHLLCISEPTGIRQPSVAVDPPLGRGPARAGAPDNPPHAHCAPVPALPRRHGTAGSVRARPRARAAHDRPPRLVRLALPWDDEVSRLHAELVRMGEDWVLCDDGLSHNGTFVNGERVRGRRRLRDGDVVTVGATRSCSTRREPPRPRRASTRVAREQTRRHADARAAPAARRRSAGRCASRPTRRPPPTGRSPTSS